MLQLSQSPVRRGNVEFARHLSPVYIDNLLTSQKLGDLLEDDEWELSIRRISQMINRGVFSCFSKVYARALKMRFGGFQGILKQINCISFPALKELHLNANFIQNLEPMATLDLRSVQIINLKQNSIYNLRPLRKFQLNNLKELYIYKNRIIDFTPLRELNAPILVTIWATPQTDTFCCRQSSSWVLLLQSPKLKRIYVKHKSGRTFDYEEVEQMLRLKLPSLETQYSMRDDMYVRLE